MAASEVASARDIMETSIVQVGADDPLVSVYRLFCDEEISGAPVVSDRGTVVGVISATDLLRTTRSDQEGVPTGSSYYWAPDTGNQLERFIRDDDLMSEVEQRVAADVMTKDLVSVTQDAPISEVVAKIRSHHIHRILVLEPGADGDQLVGIISLFDLVALLQ